MEDHERGDVPGVRRKKSELGFIGFLGGLGNRVVLERPGDDSKSILKNIKIQMPGLPLS